MCLPAHIRHRALAAGIVRLFDVLSVDHDLLTQAKVDYFELLFVVLLMNHYVIWLEVAVNEAGLVDVEDSQSHLDCNLLDDQGIESELPISVKNVLERVIISLHDDDQKPTLI